MIQDSAPRPPLGAIVFCSGHARWGHFHVGSGVILRGYLGGARKNDSFRQEKY